MLVCLMSIISAFVFLLCAKFLLWLRRQPKSIGFFHPGCGGLGGGERVLWCLVKTLLTEGAVGDEDHDHVCLESQHQDDPSTRPLASTVPSKPMHPQRGGATGGQHIEEIVIYSAKDSNPHRCLMNVKDRFGIDLTPWLQSEAATSRLPFLPTGTTRVSSSCCTHDLSIRSSHTPDAGSPIQTNTRSSPPLPSRMDRVPIEHAATTPARLTFVYLSTSELVNPQLYPRLTLLLQAVGSMVVALEATVRFTPTVFIDTTGYSFAAFVAAWVAGCRVCSYIHYPFISTDMIQVVKERRTNFNNATAVVRSPFLSAAKLVYYRGLAWCYGLCGGCMDTCVVNSTWTYSHLADLMTSPTKIKAAPGRSSFLSRLSSLRLLEHDPQIFKPRQQPQQQRSRFQGYMDHIMMKCDGFYQQCTDTLKSFHRLPLHRLSIVYPPVDIQAFTQSAQPLESRICRIVSLSQFRPEKNHDLQLDAMARLLQLYKARSVPLPPDLKLVVCGSVRCREDQVILDRLEARVSELGLGARVDFAVNQSFVKIKNILGSSKVGIHTMVDEHFGIALVEFLAAGLLVVSHNSAGPKMDILNVSQRQQMERKHFSCFSESWPSNTVSASPSRHPSQRLAGRHTRGLGVGGLWNHPPTTIDDSRPPGTKDNNQGQPGTTSETTATTPAIETPTESASYEDITSSCVAATFGYLCRSAEGFAEALFRCLTDTKESLAMMERIPSSLNRFNGNEEFGKACVSAMGVYRLLQQSYT